jgi:hypothetical protein
MSGCLVDGCKAPVLKNDEYCYFHSPNTKEQRQKSARRGGNRKKINVDYVPIETVEDIKRLIAETINELRASPTENRISKARAIGYLASVLIDAIEKSDLESRMSELEKLLTTQESFT